MKLETENLPKFFTEMTKVVGLLQTFPIVYMAQLFSSLNVTLPVSVLLWGGNMQISST